MDAGVTVIAGTDTMWEGTFFGFSTHRELELMVLANNAIEAPMALTSNMEVLKTATSNADFFMNHKRGQLRPGFYGDFVVLNSNPVEDIKNTRDIAEVFVNGELVDREALKKQMGVE